MTTAEVPNKRFEQKIIDPLPFTSSITEGERQKVREITWGVWREAIKFPGHQAYWYQEIKDPDNVYMAIGMSFDKPHIEGIGRKMYRGQKIEFIIDKVRKRPNGNQLQTYHTSKERYLFQTVGGGRVLKETHNFVPEGWKLPDGVKAIERHEVGEEELKQLVVMLQKLPEMIEAKKKEQSSGFCLGSKKCHGTTFGRLISKFASLDISAGCYYIIGL